MEPTLQQNFQPEQQTLFDLQELTVGTTRSLSELKKEKKTLQQMVKDALNSNQAYAINNQAVKQSREVLSQTKENLLRVQENAALADKLKTIASEIKEKEAAVSDYALEYERMSGKNEFEKDGELFTIVKRAKLVRALQ